MRVLIPFSQQWAANAHRRMWLENTLSIAAYFWEIPISHRLPPRFAESTAPKVLSPLSDVHKKLSLRGFLTLLRATRESGSRSGAGWSICLTVEHYGLIFCTAQYSSAPNSFGLVGTPRSPRAGLRARGDLCCEAFGDYLGATRKLELSILRIARTPHPSPSVGISFCDRGCDSSPVYVVGLHEPCPQGLCLVVRRNSRGIESVPTPRRSFPLQTTPSLASPQKVRGHCTGGGTSSWGV